MPEQQNLFIRILSNFRSWFASFGDFIFTWNTTRIENQTIIILADEIDKIEDTALKQQIEDALKKGNVHRSFQTYQKKARELRCTHDDG